LAEFTVLASAFFGCIVGSVIPIIHTELLVLGIAALAPGEHGIVLVLVATIGTMIGKTILYLAGRGALKLPIRGRDRIDRYLAKARERQGMADGVLFASAAAGLPPFYIVTVASGAVGFSLPRFWIVGFAGRLLRFTAVVYAPHLIRGLVGQ
jgi:membrane protein YqaA with SNARE-associated domain